VNTINIQTTQIYHILTHLDENIENEIKNKTNFAIYCSNGTSASRGVGIVINKSLNYAIRLACVLSFRRQVNCCLS
jgi:ubiquinone biosynthesis protein Coq4